jgi:hypothetical protein
VTISVRSGETEDDWAADLALGWAGDQFKNGSITQSERLAKYNCLLELEHATARRSIRGRAAGWVVARPRRSQPTIVHIRSVAEDLKKGNRLVFVSHSGPDTWVANQIAREIEARGATTILDEAQVDDGADFEEDIRDFLARAHELVVLLTPWALDRPYVWVEIGAAWARGLPIVALLLGITATELQTRPGVPVLLKKRDVLELNQIGSYLERLAARMRQHEG